jgi:hypothetical protein
MDAVLNWKWNKDAMRDLGSAQDLSGKAGHFLL